MAACCAAVMLFSGCEKEQHHHVITASFENASHDTKVHLEDESDGKHYPHFDVRDEINVNGITYRTEEGGSVCKFASTGENEATSPYCAVYPASALEVAATGTNYNKPYIVLPAKQVYRTVEVDGEPVQRIDAPMCGSNRDNDIRFHNLCSVMKVCVKNPTDAEKSVSVYSIEIHSTSYKLNYPDGLQISDKMDPDDPTQRGTAHRCVFQQRK